MPIVIPNGFRGSEFIEIFKVGLVDWRPRGRTPGFGMAELGALAGFV